MHDIDDVERAEEVANFGYLTQRINHLLVSKSQAWFECANEAVFTRRLTSNMMSRTLERHIKSLKIRIETSCILCHDYISSLL